MTSHGKIYSESKKRLIELQLERMEKSGVFQQAGRMYPLLDFLVRAELDNNANSLNQSVIATEVLARDADFDSVSDSIVRVEVGRLRNKLREYYGDEGAGSPVLIELPKGRYRPQLIFRRVTDPAWLPPLPPQDIRFCRTPDNVKLAYSTMGNGYPIVAPATWLTHLEIDYAQATYHHFWSELSSNHRLLRYDSRNMGLSDRRVENFSYEDLVTDLETVIDHADIERCALFSTSQSVPVAASYAARHPQRVSHVIMLSGFLRGPSIAPDTFGEGFDEAMYASLKSGWQQSNVRFREVVCRMLITDGTQEQYRLLDELQLASCDQEDVLRFADLVHKIDVTEEAPHVIAPTLILHGRGDAIPLQESYLAASLIPNSKLVILETANHLLQPDEPAWDCFVQEVNNFLKT